MKTLKNVLEYLENTGEKYRDKIAVIDEKRQITYGELINNAKLLGSYLCSKVEPNKPVAVFMDKSVRTLEVFFAIAYAGCFYTLIDPNFPPKRINQILEILDTDLIVTDDMSYKKISELATNKTIISIDYIKNIEDSISNIDIEVLESIRCNMTGEEPLYCNFTSGSTGIPKGVLISHKAVISFIDNFVDTFNITNVDVIGNQAPFDFDVSVKDIYSCLKTGATLVIIPRSYFMFPMQVMDMLDQYKVTTIIWAVSALVMITRLHGLKYKTPKSINKIMFSGEQMPLKQLNKWRRVYNEAMFVNLYGPTEITCNCTYYILDREFSNDEKLPIGISFSNSEVILIKDGKVIEKDCVGQVGEVCVSGSSLAIGYINNKEMTDKAFVSNLTVENNKRMYKTGDMAYWDKGGLLYFAGRKDFQIKHMGHRIELEEVERVLGNIHVVEQACCFFDNVKNKIIAFVVSSKDKRTIINEMKKSVPDYMIPNVFNYIDTMPINKNGKTDRNLLKQMYMEERTNG